MKESTEHIEKRLHQPEDKNIDDWKYVYFLGIGGIGMSALARYFVKSGKSVSGYDRTASGLTKTLQANGISINYNDDTASIPELFQNKEDTLIVYTPAIPVENKQLKYFRQNQFKILKRSEVLGNITRSTTCFAVAGTHGKTTTSSILAHLLYECNVEMTAFLGGIAKNYNSNFVYRGSNVSVVEADEYDRSFLTLSPDYACITSMDADHLDIYGKSENLVKSFKDFTERLEPDGKLFVKNGLPLGGITYGIEDDSDYSAQEIRIKNGTYHFHLKTPNTTYKNFEFSLPGRHNLSNAIIALAMTVEFGCPHQQLAKALATFSGVDRRFNYHIKNDNLVYIDDYAHHPTEINAVYDAVSEMYPNKQVLIIFQPHLYSRTKDFADEFAEELARFHSILLLDIYPAREVPIKGINSEWLLRKIDNQNKKLIKKENIIEEIKLQNPDIVITLGAGDIGEEVNGIKQGLLA